MTKEIKNMVKIGAHRVLIQGYEDYLLTRKCNFVIVEGLNDEELDTKKALTVFIEAGS